MSKPARMIDVARMANVGTMTVSRVVNNSATVSAETARRVHEAIQALNYQPNEMARVLRGFKSRFIGLILPSLADPFFATCAHHINIVAQEHGYSVIMTTSNDSAETELSEARWMLQKHIDGLLICPARNGVGFADAIFQSTPIVSFDRPLKVSTVANVVVMNFEGGICGTEHLIVRHHHRRIHFLGDSKELYSIQTRLSGYKRAMAGAKLTPQSTLDCSSEERVHETVSRLLSGHQAPTAFFCGNNLISRRLLKSLRSVKVDCPSEVAVIGFDDFDLADMITPAVTVVRQPVEQLGLVAAEALFAHLELAPVELPARGNVITLPVEMIVRQSCGC